MDNLARTLADRDVQTRGDTSAGTVATIGAEFEQGPRVVSLESVRQPRGQARSNTDLQRWVGSVLPAIDEFLRLPEGWDTYNGQPLKLDTGMFALQLLYDVMNPRASVPLVAPTSPGGVQFEWHQGQLELELCINAPYDCELSFRDRATGEEQSYNLTTDFSPLTRLMLRLQSGGQAAA
jgi:hypothetical protein